MRVGRVVVGGHSMRPALEHGDHLLYVGLRPRVGDVAISRDPREPERWLVKRVAAVSGPGARLASDLAGHERVDVTSADLIGRAVLRYRPLRRLTLL